MNVTFFIHRGKPPGNTISIDITSIVRVEYASGIACDLIVMDKKSGQYFDFRVKGRKIDIQLYIQRIAQKNGIPLRLPLVRTP